VFIIVFVHTTSTTPWQLARWHCALCALRRAPCSLHMQAAAIHLAHRIRFTASLGVYHSPRSNAVCVLVSSSASSLSTPSALQKLCQSLSTAKLRDGANSTVCVSVGLAP